MTQMDKTIISFIVDYYRESQFCPSYDEIAEGIGRTKSTVYTHMRKLESEGIIIRKADYSPQYRLINMEFILGAGGDASWRRTVEKYENKDKKCECWRCELKDSCPYRDKYQRLPRTNPGALGLCKKL